MNFLIFKFWGFHWTTKVKKVWDNNGTKIVHFIQHFDTFQLITFEQNMIPT